MTANTEWPGLPNYTGPTAGWFTLLHHQGPHFEYSDNVLERIDFINAHKPEHERAIRLRHIRFVSVDVPSAWAEYERVKAPSWAALDAEIRRLIPDCRWNGKTLIFETEATNA